MNRSSNSVIVILALSSFIIGCSDEAKHKETAEKARHSTTTAQEMANHAAHEMSGHAEGETPPSAIKPCTDCATDEIGRKADDLPPPIDRKESQLVTVDLYTDELVAEMMPEVTYQYWTYNGKVPGPFIRARAGDQIEIRLSHGKPGAVHQDHDEHTSTQHTAAGHSAHSIDLHAVIGPGGGAPLTQVGQGEEKRFRFKATRPGVYVYHCSSPHAPTHIANGMYGMILVEPEQGLAKVDREFYVMQGDFYTSGKYGDKGLQAFSKEKLLDENPEYFLFNGRVNSLSGDRALKAKVGQKLRLFVGVGSHIAANFHIVGEIFDNLYPEGAIMSPPLRNVQTTIIAPGSAVMIEFTAEVPGKYLLVDHSLTRSFDKGAMAELIVEGPERSEFYQPVSH
ncbi:multicopper oxidase domain-containing protein [Methylomicrobium sp. Wu6]|uniref:multicopper oxidase domain-containing protein n=1 Tax=Methylomicrobium sp. Wu6 TaxID=3107928 RepID=UPI002DD63991|nr:multicopper oxidase domain-containing protein [Methylomicrobium sp. Wu6]MEC4748374.1 multicopper oxidase domain-containing protein [Methylomicrobium sp. Wu6]